MKIKHCWICGKEFEPKTAWQRYCSRKCNTENWRNSKGRIVDKGRHCRQCGIKFIPPRKGGANMQHCSATCAIKSARESRCNFYKKNPNKYIIQQFKLKTPTDITFVSEIFNFLYGLKRIDFPPLKYE